MTILTAEFSSFHKQVQCNNHTIVVSLQKRIPYVMLSSEVKALIPKIRKFFSTQPVTKAWLFGSCSRGEESMTSDIDILVTYDSNTRVTLFTIGGMVMELSSLTGRDVDLVEDSGLYQFARKSVDRDKILIYEREGISR